MRKINDGFSAIALCDYLGWDYGEVLVAAKVAGLKPDRDIAKKRSWGLQQYGLVPNHATFFRFGISIHGVDQDFGLTRYVECLTKSVLR